jgi:hypothetical protein
MLYNLDCVYFVAYLSNQIIKRIFFMFLINFCRKLNFSLLIRTIILVCFVSTTFGTINIHNNGKEQEVIADLQNKQIFSSLIETKRFNLLTNNITSFFNGKDINQINGASQNTAGSNNVVLTSGATFLADCTYSINPTSQSFPNTGGGGTVAVTTQTGCTYTAVSNASWITVTAGAAGSGNGTVTFTVAANTGIARTGTITIAGQTFTVTQASGCTYTLSPTGANIQGNAQTGSFTVNTGTGCAYTVASNDPFITVISGASGTGSGTVSYSVAVNNTGSARTGTITAGGQTFTVIQTPLPVLTINNATLNEGNSGTTPFTFTISLSAALGQPVTVNYTSVNGTATAGEDYAAASGTITFAPGEVNKTITIPVSGDTLVEGNETFTINLSGATNAIISIGQGSGTILNDDSGGSVQFSLSNYTVNENDGTATITVSRTGGTGSGVTVNYATSNGTATAGADYTAVSGTLTFAANETSKTFTIPITDDTLNEQNETVIITLSNVAGGGLLGPPSTSILTIIDNDGAPTLSISSVLLNERNSGTTEFKFIVTLLAPSGQTVTVNYGTANDTATTPSDYQATSGSLTFAPGETTKTITVLVNGDTDVELNETFTVNLSNAVNASIANGTGTGFIQNDDFCVYSISPTRIIVSASGGTGNTFSVTTQAPCPRTATTTDSFITIDSGTNGTGNGTITFSVAPNGGNTRVGTIRIGDQILTVVQTAIPLPNAPVRFDFDGDKRADVSVFRPDTGYWYLLNSTTGFNSVQFGIATDKIVPADYDGDGKTDIAVWRVNPSNPNLANFYILNSSNNSVRVEQLGSSGDLPMATADWDGDGRSDPAVYRDGANGGQSYFFYRPSSQPAVNFVSVPWGIGGDKPVVGDYDGDAKADAAVFRPSNGIWYILRSRDGFSAIQFGASTDKPVVGDYDGDGRADVAVYRPSEGNWYQLRSTEGFYAVQFGNSTDLLVPADYDGDGKTDVAVFRPDGGNWYQLRSTLGFGAVQFGANGDRPIPNAFIP